MNLRKLVLTSQFSRSATLAIVALAAASAGICACSNGDSPASPAAQADAGAQQDAQQDALSDSPVGPDAGEAEATTSEEGSTDTGSGEDSGEPEDGSPPDAVPADAAEEATTAEDSSTADVAPATLTAISVQELHDALPTKNFLLINVHVPYEGEVPQTDAKLSYVDPQAIAAYLGADLDAKVVVYCKSNYMSGIAGNDLVGMGYRGIRYLDGGMSAWTAAGYPLDNKP